MILGMSTATFTLLHVLISMVGIGSGFIVIAGLLARKRLEAWTKLFLATTVLTTLTGFLFPIKGVTPGIVIGVLSLLMLALAIVARYSHYMSGAWRWIYIVTTAIALYFNTFVMVVQSFEKVAALKALAPTQKEPPFLIAQFALLILFIVLTTMSVRRFHGEATTA
jgi:hypothetical protein